MRSHMLTRYFSVLSFFLIAAAGVFLGYSVYRNQVQQMEALAQDRNILTTRLFQNLLLDDIRRLARDSVGVSREHLANHADIAGLRRSLEPLMRDSGIVKVKIYAPSGMTIFSTQQSQIGEDKSDNAGFQSALRGRVASELTHRDEFSAFDGVRNDLDLVSSYLPVEQDGQVVAIFELYQDVTKLMGEIGAARFIIGGMIAAVLGVLFLFQWVVVKRAQDILVRHEDRLEQDNLQLGQRVEEGTRELEISHDRIEHLSSHDILTGLANRTLVFDRLQQAMSRLRGTPETLAVVLIDLDQFSVLNDTRGHEAGDALLRSVANVLELALRPGDTLARLGGDEFIIILEGLDARVERAAEVANDICQDLRRAIREGYRLPAGDFAGSGSLGVTLYAGGDESPEELLGQAELAMYRSKDDGRDRVTFFDPLMAEHLQLRTRLESDLRRAIQGGELVLHFQPQVHGGTGRVVGAEALVRWQHPERGLLAPGEFIGLAEESGLILPLGQWVLETACRQLAAWQGRPEFADLVLAVNVSVQQFAQPDFTGQIVDILLRTGVRPEKLKLELTESLFAENIERVVQTMNELRSVGIGFSLDDFGTGYSSLAYLGRLPMDQIKIDRSFVANIGDAESHGPICSAIIGLAHALDLVVVAEGVETEMQRYFLATLHRCDQLQGYLISRPVPLPEFERFVTAQSVLSPDEWAI